jgi:hypothetical protein
LYYVNTDLLHVRTGGSRTPADCLRSQATADKPQTLSFSPPGVPIMQGLTLVPGSAMTPNYVTAFSVKSFDVPDKKRYPDKAQVDLVSVNDYSVARLILAPGWRWSENSQPTEKTEFCQHNHLGFCISGTLEIATPDGLVKTIRANDTYAIPPGHDEWVVGSEPFVAVEFLGAASFGRPSSHGQHARI